MGLAFEFLLKEKHHLYYTSLTHPASDGVRHSIDEAADFCVSEFGEIIVLIGYTLDHAVCDPDPSEVLAVLV